MRDASKIKFWFSSERLFSPLNETRRLVPDQDTIKSRLTVALPLEDLF